jgi:hypothetical protein
MGEDGGSYQGNGTLTLIKLSSVRIMDNPNKVGSASDNGMGIMSSNIFTEFKHFYLGSDKFDPKKTL